jgi:hypothetical protein
MVNTGRKGLAVSSHPWLLTETRIQRRTLQDCDLGAKRRDQENREERAKGWVSIEANECGGGLYGIQ